MQPRLGGFEGLIDLELRKRSEIVFPCTLEINKNHLKPKAWELNDGGW
jgi:hypothetical protein